MGLENWEKRGVFQAKIGCFSLREEGLKKEKKQYKNSIEKTFPGPIWRVSGRWSSEVGKMEISVVDLACF